MIVIEAIGLWWLAGIIGSALFALSLGNTIRPYTYGDLGNGIFLSLLGPIATLCGFVALCGVMSEKWGDKPIFSSKK